eukprot:2456031-Amphidinium_carterae.1
MSASSRGCRTKPGKSVLTCPRNGRVFRKTVFRKTENMYQGKVAELQGHVRQFQGKVAELQGQVRQFQE